MSTIKSKNKNLSNPNEPPPPPSTTVSNDNDDDVVEDDHEHATLHKYPYFWAAVGVSQTFLTAIMFGWASLVPVLRSEGLTYTPEQLS